MKEVSPKLSAEIEQVSRIKAGKSNLKSRFEVPP
jgi:hypothetical protein